MQSFNICACLPACMLLSRCHFKQRRRRNKVTLFTDHVKWRCESIGQARGITPWLLFASVTSRVGNKRRLPAGGEHKHLCVCVFVCVCLCPCVCLCTDLCHFWRQTPESTYPVPMLNLPHTRGKLCHKTTFLWHAILLKQLCLHSFCLSEGMHNILKYMQIY